MSEHWVGLVKLARLGPQVPRALAGETRDLAELLVLRRQELV